MPQTEIIHTGKPWTGQSSLHGEHSVETLGLVMWGSFLGFSWLTMPYLLTVLVVNSVLLPPVTVGTAAALCLGPCQTLSCDFPGFLLQ